MREWKAMPMWQTAVNDAEDLTAIAAIVASGGTSRPTAME